MEGGIRNKRVVAIRIKSDIVFANTRDGANRMEWYTKERGTYGALVLLYGTEDGQLLAIMNDGVIQQYRVGGTGGLAAKVMAKADTKVVGILGSGGLAHTHALAYAAVLPVEQFKVYSPNPANRTKFAEWITKRTGVPATAYDSAEQVATDVQVLAACTDASSPVISSDWIRPGMHLRPVQGVGNPGEIAPDGYQKVDRLVTYLSGISEHHFTTPETDRPLFLGASTPEDMLKFEPISNKHTLPEVLLGMSPGRENVDEINCFVDEGTGVQFAAVAALVYDHCRDRGIGRELPSDWFLQDVKN